MTYKRYISLLLAIVIIMTTSIGSTAETIDTEAKFNNYILNGLNQRLISPNIETSEVAKKKANFKVYRTYNVVVYGYPFGRWKGAKSGNWTNGGNKGEYEYLGYDYYGNKITNSYFENDAISANFPYTTKFKKVKDAPQSWDRVAPKIVEYILLQEFIYQEKGPNPLPGVTVNWIGGKNYVRIERLPSCKSIGVLYTNDIWGYYQTWAIKPLAEHLTFTSSLTPEEPKYTMYATDNSVEIPITVTSTANLDSNRWIDEDHIESFSLDFRGDSTSVEQNKTVTLETTITVNRSELKLGENTLELEATGVCEMACTDRYNVTASGSVVIDVQEPKEIVQTPTEDPNKASIDILSVVNPEATEWDDSSSMMVDVYVESNLYDVNPDLILFYELSVNGEEKHVESHVNNLSNTFKMEVDCTPLEDDDTKNNITKTWNVQAKAILSNGRTLTANDTKETLITRGYEPPKVRVSAPKRIKLGDPARLRGSARSPSGLSIDFYFWDVDNTPLSEHDDKTYISNYYFPSVGEYKIGLEAIDSMGQDGYDFTHTEVLPPTVDASINYDGILKENRAIYVHSNNSRSPKRYPIKDDTANWTVTPKDSVQSSDLFYDRSNIDGNRDFNFMSRRNGSIDFSIFLENTANYSDTAELTLPIAKDLEPVADFTVLGTVYRNIQNFGQATLSMFNRSYSPDGDKLKTLDVWLVFDANNNDVFIDDMDNKELIYSGENKALIEHDVSSVGKYLPIFEVTETYETLPDYEDSVPYLSDDTSDKPLSESVIEVDNLKPSINLELINKIPFTMTFQKSTFSMSTSEITSYVENSLKPYLEANGYELKKYDVVDSAIKEYKSGGRTVSSHYYNEFSDHQYGNEMTSLRNQYGVYYAVGGTKETMSNALFRLIDFARDTVINLPGQYAHYYSPWFSTYFYPGGITEDAQYIYFVLGYNGTQSDSADIPAASCSWYIYKVSKSDNSYEIFRFDGDGRRYRDRDYARSDPMGDYELSNDSRYYALSGPAYLERNPMANGTLYVYDMVKKESKNFFAGFTIGSVRYSADGTCVVANRQGSSDQLVVDLRTMTQITHRTISQYETPYIDTTDFTREARYYSTQKVSGRDEDYLNKGNGERNYYDYHFRRNSLTGTRILMDYTYEYTYSQPASKYSWISGLVTSHFGGIGTMMYRHTRQNSWGESYYSMYAKKYNFSTTLMSTMRQKTNDFHVVLDNSNATLYNLRDPFYQKEINNYALLNGVTLVGVNSTNNQTLKNMINKTKGFNVSDLNEFASALVENLNEKYRRSDSNEIIITVDDDIEMDLAYWDYEGDPINAGGYKLTHVDPNYFENSTGVYPDSGVNKPLKQGESLRIPYTGKYDFEGKVQDRPSDNLLFADYMKWSDDDIKNILLVHRKPIAEFDFKLFNGGYQLIDKSRDLDHESEPNKGIVKWNWMWQRNSEGVKMGLPKQEDIIGFSTYTLWLQVEDKEGELSEPFKLTKSTGMLETIPLTLEATLKGEDDGNELDAFKPDSNLLWYDIKTNNQHNDIRLELSLYDLSDNQIGNTKTVQFNTAQGSEVDQFNINWNEQSFFVDEPLVNDGEKYKVVITAIDNTDDANKDTVTGEMTIRKNSPPVIESMEVSPKIIYEGDDVDLDVKVNDEDLDPLVVTVKLKKGSTLIDTFTKNVNPTGGVYPTLTFNALDNSSIGVYTYEVEVKDTYNESDTGSGNFAVQELNIDGFVNHTPEWNANRMKYNNSKTGTDNSPRSENTYWSGEMFVLSSDTTPIDPLSDVQAMQVEVELLRTGEDARLDADDPNRIRWSGDMANKNWINKWGNNSPETLTLRFTCTWNNGTVKTDDVDVIIDNEEAYWQLHRKY